MDEESDTAEPQLYQVTLTNLPLEQAKSLYRFLVNLQDHEPTVGTGSCSWSGTIPGKRGLPDGWSVERTITLDPMPTHDQATRERDLMEMARGMAQRAGYQVSR